jgi:hypothetical protein
VSDSGRSHDGRRPVTAGDSERIRAARQCVVEERRKVVVWP